MHMAVEPVEICIGHLEKLACGDFFECADEF